MPHDLFYMDVSDMPSVPLNSTPPQFVHKQHNTADTFPRSTGAVAVAALTVAPLLLAGCSKGGDGSVASNNAEVDTTFDSSPMLTFTAIEIRVTATSTMATISINGQTPAPTPTTAAFPLNGVVLPIDPGKKAATTTYELSAHVTGDTTDKLYTITLNPGIKNIREIIGPAKFDQAKHLAMRTGFGASLDDILTITSMTYEQAVERMVDTMSTTSVQATPGWVNSDFNTDKWRYWRGQKMWWMQEIVMTPTPFTERMIAFWSNHFVTNIEELVQPRIGWAWQDFLRKNVSGNLRTFAHDMCLHPAMQIYLDNRYNYKCRAPGAPKSDPANLPSNENFGRELLELFLLGEGHLYTETDVINVARAFTGHNLGVNFNYTFYPQLHDDSTDLTILGNGPQAFGETGGNVYDIIDTIFAATEAGDSVPRVARFVVEKLWQEFIGTTPSATEVRDLALVLFNNNWELKPLYKAFFKHSAFKDLNAARKMIKMPLEYICGFYRSLGVLPGNNRWDIRVDDCIDEDQNPFAPPIVKGWLGGKTWIDSKTLVQRFVNMTTYGNQLTDGQLAKSWRADYELLLLTVNRAFPAPTPTAQDKNPFSTLLRALVLDPSYQMK